MPKTVTVGRSVQVIQIGQPESWNKFTISDQVDDEVETVQEVIESLYKTVCDAHDKHSQSFIESQIAPKDKRQTFQDLKNELNAPGK